MKIESPVEKKEDVTEVVEKDYCKRQKPKLTSC